MAETPTKENCGTCHYWNLELRPNLLPGDPWGKCSAERGVSVACTAACPGWIKKGEDDPDIIEEAKILRQAFVDQEW